MYIGGGGRDERHMTLAENANRGFRRLEWDTNCFGFEVAISDWRRIGEPARIESLGELRRTGVVLAYVIVDPGDQAGVALASCHGLRLVDHKLIYRCDLSANRTYSEIDASNGAVRPFEGMVPTADMIDLAIEAGKFSRFKLDPLIPSDCFRRLYRTWIERSVSREIADQVFVSVDSAGAIRGMATVALSPGMGTIGLIAIAPAAQGQGLGRELIAAVHAYCKYHNRHAITAATQQANLPACQFYKQAGYIPVERSLTYHWWQGG